MPIPPGSARKRVGEIGHLRLALVHVGDAVELGEAGVRDLEVDQRGRDDAVDLAAELEHAVGDQAHQAEPAAAVDQVDVRGSAIAAAVARVASANTGSLPGADPQ